MMKLMPNKSITPGPRDERGVLAARIVAAARDEFAEHGWAGGRPGDRSSAAAGTQRYQMHTSR
jgi:hypothetical protein